MIAASCRESQGPLNVLLEFNVKALDTSGCNTVLANK